MPELVYRNREGREACIPLTTRPLTIGRAESCEVVLRHDVEVSRAHAQVWLDEDGYVFVTDLDSKNGTRVDAGEAFRNSTRPAQSVIRIGEYELTIRGAPEVRPVDAVRETVQFMPDPPDRLTHTAFFPSSRGFDLSRQRLELLISLWDRMGGALERKQLLEQALAACCDALQFERGLIVLKTPRGEPELPVARNVERDETGAYKVSRTLINRALLHGERAVVNDPATDLIGNTSDSLVRFPIRSALCVPVLHRDEVLGVIYGDRITQAARYTPQDVDFLAAIAQQLGVGLSSLRLLQDYVRLQRVETELSAARRIQRDLLPAAPLERGAVRVEGYNEPSSEVGGDYYDYVELDDEHVGFVIADVTGHGLPAALIMANFQAAIHVALNCTTPLPDSVARINRLVCRNTGSHVFITAIVGILNTRSGAIEYVNAGHPPPILIGRTPPPGPEHNSLPLGIDPEDRFTVQRIERQTHEGAVFFYTDGLIESAGPAGALLGIEPIQRALTKLREPTTSDALRVALEVERAHRGEQTATDDLTLLAIQFGLAAHSRGAGPPGRV